MTTNELVSTKAKTWLKNTFTSIESAKDHFLSTLDEDGTCQKMDLPDVPGVFVKYITNPNYQGGFNNGGGKGFYVERKGVGFTRTEKI